MRPRRKATAVLCVALVIFAALGPALAAPLAFVSLVPLWYEFQPDLTFVVFFAAGEAHEQPQPFVALPSPRAPPHS